MPTPVPRNPLLRPMSSVKEKEKAGVGERGNGEDAARARARAKVRVPGKAKGNASGGGVKVEEKVRANTENKEMESQGNRRRSGDRALKARLGPHQHQRAKNDRAGQEVYQPVQRRVDRENAPSAPTQELCFLLD